MCRRRCWRDAVNSRPTRKSGRRRTKAWIEELAEKLAGERVFILAPAQLIYDVAKPALAEGKRCHFAPNSSVTAGTGGKGFNMPDDWEQVVDDFLNFGRENYGYFYSFSEQCGMHVQCEHGRLHLYALVDPADSRSGYQRTAAAGGQTKGSRRLLRPGDERRLGWA